MGILTLDDFHQLYPAAQELAQLGRPREWLWRFDLPGEPERVWPVVSDTARTNRAAGTTPMRYRIEDGQLRGQHRTAAVQHRFVERWQWVTRHSLELVREYQSGLARLFRQIYRIEPHEGGTSRLYVLCQWVPRGALGPLAVRLGMAWFERRFRQVVEDLGRELAAVGADPEAAAPERLLRQPGRLAPERRHRVDALRRELIERGVDAGALDRLIDLAVHGDDLELDPIRLRQVARDGAVDQRALLVAALHATRAGLLELSWDVVCPHCRGVGARLAHLGEVPEGARCDACAVEFGTDREHAIEVAFRVHRSIREVPQTAFCTALPSRQQHIHVQQALAAGEERTVVTELPPGRYRVRHLRGEGGWPLEVVDQERAPAGQALACDPVTGPAAARVGPRPQLVLRGGDAGAVFVVEQMHWHEGALRPIDLFNLPDFRDLFSEEYLSAGVRLHIGEQTVLFTDIVGSTRFYAEVGDPVAFVEVKRHFTRVFAAVEAAGGVVVKTIGDAVMAAFSDPRGALDAAAEIHRAFPGAERGGPGACPVRLRISIHRGPCIAVNLNSGIDYFGGTVNTAAKLQQCAEAGEVALSAELVQAPGAGERLARLGGARRETTLDHEALGRLAVTVWTPVPDESASAGAGVAGGAL